MRLDTIQLDTIQNATTVLVRIDITINKYLILIITIIVIAFVLYILRGKYKLIYNKIILKMGNFEKSYNKAKDCFEKNDFIEALSIVESSLDYSDLPSEWEGKFEELKSQIEDGSKQHELKTEINEFIENNQILDAIATIGDLYSQFGKLKHIEDYVNDLAKNRLSLSSSEINISYISELIKKTEVIPLLRESYFFKELNVKKNELIYKQTETDINNALSEFDLDRAYDFIKNSSKELTDRQKKELNDIINNFKQKVDEIRESISKAKKNINDFNFSDDIDKLEEKINEDSCIFNIVKKEYEELRDCCNKANEAIQKEESYHGDFSIINLGGFNVPKIEGKGEDADPLIDVEENRNWGIISVFDGLGGSGAMDYTNTESKERHTGAYWASRFVRESIVKLVQDRPKGEEPLGYIEKNIKSFIEKNLNDKIKEFTIETTDVIAKDMDYVFPTTMALCVYKLEDSKLTINCYWAGDSRIYLFDGQKFIFLTIDDSDAGGDPFSTVNIDLPMTNKISQNKEFYINKSVYQHELENNIPISLIATTDGCYGYYLNPIVFEHMILSCLINGEFNDYMDRIRQSVIDNGQQDDLSMAITIIGGDKDKEKCMKSIKELAAGRLNNPIFKVYLDWRKTQTEERTNLEIRSQNLGNMMKKKKVLGDYSREFIENTKSYLSKISTLDRDHSAIDIGINDIQSRIKDLLTKELEPIVSDKYYLSAEDSYRKSKNDISEFKLSSKDENESWYQKYKKEIEIIDNKNIKKIQ